MTREEIYLEIDNCVNLQDNWDGYGAVPSTTLIGERSKKFISLLEDFLVEKVDDIMPNPHGTITIEWVNNSKEKLSLEIGNTLCGYFISHSNKRPTLVDEADLFKSFDLIKSDILSLYDIN